MAILATLKPTRSVDRFTDRFEESVTSYFSGASQHWRETFDDLLAQVGEFGPVDISPTNSYLSLMKNGVTFAIVAATATRLDIGIKLPGIEPAGRFEAAGAWNSMVTHRVRIADAAEIDTQLLNWLADAYKAA